MEIVKKRIWNDSEYCTVQYADGHRVELKGKIDECTDAQWLQLAKRIEQPSEQPNPVLTAGELTDEQLVSEIKRRKLDVMVRGTAR